MESYCSPFDINQNSWENIDLVLFACCSVFDKNYWYGQLWFSKLGPNYFLGYRAAGSGGDTDEAVMNKWIELLENQDPAEAWINANYSESQWNATAYDNVHKKYWYITNRHLFPNNIEVEDWSADNISQSLTILENSTQQINFTEQYLSLQFSGNHTATNLTVSYYNLDGGVTGELPQNISNIANRYWEIHSSESNVGTYNVSFDISSIEGIANFNTLHILKRDNYSQSWQNVVSLGATVIYDYPNITVSGLASFSDFVVAGESDNPLPVQLSSFTAFQTSENLVQINWTTQSESGLLGYNIYRSEVESFNNSTKLNSSFINPANTTTAQNYSYTDGEVDFSQTYFYWIESVELEGDTELFGPISLTIESPEIIELPSVSLLKSAYPNPFNPTTTIAFDIKEGETGILSIFNTKGQKIKSENFQAGRHEYKWQPDKNASGVYFYKLQTVSYSKISKMLMLK